MKKTLMIGVSLVLGALLLASCDRPTSLTPTGLEKDDTSATSAFATKLTQDYLAARWYESLVTPVVKINSTVDLVQGGTVTGLPAGYPGADYTCSVTIPAGAYPGGGSAEIVIEVDEYDANPPAPHAAAFRIFTTGDKDLILTSPATVTLCDFPWTLGNTTPTPPEFIYLVHRDGDLYSYEYLQEVTGDPATGAITFPLEIIPRDSWYRPDLEDHSGIWMTEGDEDD